MITHGRTEEATKALRQRLADYDNEPNFVIDEFIHTWLPGVKSIIPVPYSEIFEAALLALPVSTSKQADYGVESHADQFNAWVRLDGYLGVAVSHISVHLALVTASVECYLSFFQSENSKKEENKK